jgi:CBS domain-containing protein
MVTDRDIVVRAVAEERPAGNTSVREVMSDGICYCFEDDEVEQAVQVMASHQVRSPTLADRKKKRRRPH